MCFRNLRCVWLLFLATPPITPTCHLQKFLDGSAIVGCISKRDEREYREVILEFVQWREQNHLLLKTNKTKELVADFRQTTQSHTAVNIQGSDIEMVDSFKYLGP